MPTSPTTVPLGHFDPKTLSEIFREECSLIGGLVIAWGQFDRELSGLFSRLLGFSPTKPPDPRAIAVFYSSSNSKARRDAMVSMVKLVDDTLCKEWLIKALDKVATASDKRNNIIHSEYFADLEDVSKSYLLKTTPAGKNPESKRNGIQQQLIDAIAALSDASYYMEFAYAAIGGRKSLDEALALYEPSLRERGDWPRPQNPPSGSR